MNAKIATAVLVSLLALGSAAPLEGKHLSTLEATKTENDDWKAFEQEEEASEATEEHLVPMALHSFGNTCGAYANLPIKSGAVSLLQDGNVPGAGVDGIDELKPFEKVLKDGFLATDCVKDYMYYRGDKFGDNKHDYKLDFSRVSIVHYDAFVAEGDRSEMTPKLCFEFCRTVPNMGFFGIVNGRGCYCTPYYQAMESDDSQCDAVCEGDHTLACGGTSKSSVFAMHMCDSTKDDLLARKATAEEVKKVLEVQEKLASDLSKQMQGAADKLQKSFGKVGDSAATDLMQEAKVFAGKLIHKVEDSTVVSNKLGGLLNSSKSLKGFSDSGTVTKAERIMEGIDENVADGEAMSSQLFSLTSLAQGQGITSEAEPEKAEGDVIDEANLVWGTFGPGKPWLPFSQLMSNTKKNTFPGRTRWLRDIGTVVPGTKVTPENIATLKGTMMKLFIWRIALKLKWVVPAPPAVKSPSLLGYYPVMYFVDKEFEAAPTTCNGARVGEPIVGVSALQCGLSCDANIHSCVAFQHFKDGDNQLCFLLSGFSKGSYYTGCGKEAFLQTSAAPFEAKCYAKLSKFKGIDLTPNPSGKCALCFKQLQKADRCYA